MIQPVPGIYYDVPFDVYLSWAAISNSQLSIADTSLAHYRQWLDGRGTEETEAMRFGTLCHCGQLEPQAIDERYIVMPPFEDQVRKADGARYDSPKATKAYKDLVAEFEESTEKSGKIIVTTAKFEMMKGLV